MWSASDALLRSATDMFEAGDFSGAFRKADRLCRVAEPDARILFLRAKSLQHLDKDDAAGRDLRAAFLLDPVDPLIARAVLLSDLSELHAAAARALVVSPRTGTRSLRLAVRWMLANGQRVVAHLRSDGAFVRGWIVWKGAEDLEVVVADQGRSEHLTLRANGDHGLADPEWHAASMETPLSACQRPTVQFFDGSDRVDAAFVNFQDPPTVESSRPKAHTEASVSSRLCTVIVPIYDDLATTALCLEALARQQGSDVSVKIILVNDRPGDPDMRALTRNAATAKNFELMENETNLGFVGSINTALATISRGDVLLLNSDAILPPRAIERLWNAAHSHADVGTVTPLTNNGEMTNWPRPLQSNPMRSRRGIERIDAIALQVNRDRVVTLPCGIGFCLYIRADCLAAVGHLSTAYLRGYLEDVEFCLRAREVGFRNVCASNVYVGHAGTRSFGEEKRALVVRNLKVLEGRFPDISADTLAFLQADPLSEARIAIESRAARAVRKGYLVVARVREDPCVQKRVDHLEASGLSVLTLTGLSFDQPFQMTLRLEGDGSPQSSSYDATQLKDNSALVALLRRLRVRNVEVFADCVLPGPLSGLLAVGDFKIRPVVDAYPFRVAPRPVAARCDVDGTADVCAQCQTCVVPPPAPDPKDLFVVSKAAGKGLRPLALSRMAEALFRDMRIPVVMYRRHPAKGESPQHPSGTPSTSRPDDAKQAPRRRPADSLTLGIISPTPTAQSERLLRLIAGSAARIKARRALVIFGGCLDDLSMSSFPDTAVTGPVDPKDYGNLVRLYDIDMLFAPERWAGFQLIDELAQETGLPHAYFDWSFGKMEQNPAGLALDPRICDKRAVRTLLEWTPAGEGSLGERS